MGLTKDATLRLRVQGFAEAEREAKSLATGLDQAQRLADKLGDEAGAAGKKAEDGLEKAGTAAKGLAREVGGSIGGVARLSGVLDKLGASAVALGAVGVKAVQGFGALFAIAERGEKIGGIATSFDRLSGGADKAKDSLSQLRQSTGGAVADSDLMVSANRVLSAQLGITTDQLGEAARAAILLGKANGVDATAAVQRLSEGLAKQEPELLDELGLKVDLQAALSKEAAARGVAVTALGTQARAQIFANAVLEQARARSQDLGGSEDELATKTAKLATVWENLTDRISAFLVEKTELISSLEKIGYAAIKLAEYLTPLIEKLVRIEALVGAVAGAAGGAIAGATIGAAGGPLGMLVGGGLGMAGGAIAGLAGGAVVGEARAKLAGPPATMNSALEERDKAIVDALRGSRSSLSRRLSMQGM